MADEERKVRAPSTLADVRASIDEADGRIVALLAERRRHALLAARFKSAADGVKDASREEQVVANVRALAEREGIEPDLVETLYRDMIAGFVRVEQATGEHHAPPVVENSNVEAFDAIVPPEEMKQRVRLSERALATVVEGRRTLEAILDGRDPRLLVVVGPCTIHDPRGGPRLRAPAARARRRGLRHGRRADARLLREAPQLARLGGVHPRSAAERVLPDQGGDGARPAPAAGGQRARPARRGPRRSTPSRRTTAETS